MKTWALTYTYVPDILEKRAPHREGHLALANDGLAKGTIISGGPLLGGTPAKPVGALFLFRASSESVVADFVAKDPYISAGLVPSYKIEEYSVVVGGLASKL